MRKKVLVTGIGIMSPLGIGIDEHIDALTKGKCGINFEQSLNNQYPEFLGQVPKYKPEEFIDDKKSIRIMNKRTILGCCAARLALEDSKLTKQYMQNENDEDNAIIFAAGVAEGITSIKEAIIPCVDDEGSMNYDKLGSEGYRMVPPLWILQKLPNTTAGQITIQNSIKGLNYTIVNEAHSGFQSIGEAYISIESGRTSRVFCGGSEGEIHTDFFWLMKDRNIASDTKNGSRPFGENSDGAILSEGSSVIILEEEEKARFRHASVYASILSYTNMYIPEFKQADIERLSIYYEKSMRKAIQDAGLSINDIDFIQASACGIQKNDFSEALAIKNIFENKPFITTSHSYIGHTLAASGPISVSFALIQLSNSFIAPIIRLEKVFFENELNYVKEYPIRHKSQFCLVNSFDYCGNASTLILSKEGR